MEISHEESRLRTDLSQRRGGDGGIVRRRGGSLRRQDGRPGEVGGRGGHRARESRRYGYGTAVSVGTVTTDDEGILIEWSVGLWWRRGGSRLSGKKWLGCPPAGRC